MEYIQELEQVEAYKHLQEEAIHDQYATEKLEAFQQKLEQLTTKFHLKEQSLGRDNALKEKINELYGHIIKTPVSMAKVCNKSEGNVVLAAIGCCLTYNMLDILCSSFAARHLPLTLSL